MENPIMINRVSHEEQRRIRDEAFRDHDEGRISIELKALQEMFPADDSRTGERIKAVTRYVNRAGGTTELCYDGEADIFDAEGILIMTVFGVDEHATHNIIKEHPPRIYYGADRRRRVQGRLLNCQS